MAEAQKYASFDPSDMKEGSNLFDNVNLEIIGARYSKEAPDNYQAEGNPIFAWVDFFLYDLPADPNQKSDEPDPRKVNNAYSLGASAGENFTISEDGHGLIPVDSNKDEQGGVINPLRRDSKWGTYTDSLKKEGVSPAILKTGDISKLVGLKGMHKRVADKERSFGKQNERSKKFPPSTLCLVKLVQAPGEKAKTASASSVSTPATSSAPSTTVAGDLDTQVGVYLAKVVKAKGGKVQRGQLTLLVSQAAMKETNRQDIARRAGDEAFLISVNEAGGVLDESGEIFALKYDPTAKPQVVTAA